MNLETAIDYLTNTKKRKVSEIGKAIDVLYQEYHSYENISKKLGKSSKFLSKIHHIFKLPEGVKWKVDEGHIGTEQGYQISRLAKKDDQWLLAFTIIEEKLRTKECEDVVNIVIKQNRPLKYVLSESIGVRFDKIKPLLLPIGFDIQFAISRASWEKRENWKDLCYRLIRQGLDVNIQEFANQLKELAADLEKAGSKKDSTEK